MMFNPPRACDDAGTRVFLRPAARRARGGRRLVGLVAALSVMLATPALAQIGQRGGPIDLSGDRVEHLDDQGLIRWTGNVDVRQGEARLLADMMDVYVAKGPDGRPSEILRIEALGSVAYITVAEIARADQGVYDAATGLIELTGNLNVLRGEDVLVGDRLTFDPATGRSVINSATGSAPANSGRVRAIFGQPTDSEGG